MSSELCLSVIAASEFSLPLESEQMECGLLWHLLDNGEIEVKLTIKILAL